MCKVYLLNKLWFIWFGGEEFGELGSKYYVSYFLLSELGKIRYDFDVDVMVMLNYLIGIFDLVVVDLFGCIVSEMFF